MKLTDIHREILEEGAQGVCINYEWRWIKNGRNVTRQVKAMIKHGLLEATYYMGGKAEVHSK